MKKRISLIAVLFALSSCSFSYEKKAEALIRASIQESLIFPDSYQPIKTKLDSAFSPQHDTSYIQLCCDYLGLETEQSVVAMEKSQMEFEQSLKASHQQDQGKYDSLIQRYEDLTKQLETLGDTISALSAKAPEFIGYFAYQSYSAKNDAGETMIGGKYFLFDRDISTIIHVWEKEELELYDTFITQLRDE